MNLRKRYSLDHLVSSKHSEYDRKTAYERGFEDCRKKVLTLLQQDWTGADMSINTCDKYYIDKVKEL